MKDNKLVHKLEKRVCHAFRTARIRSVLVAISGGADSVALLTACQKISQKLGLRVEAVNCNFHLRGEESDRDTKFTAGLCQKLGIKLYCRDYDVDSYISQHPRTSTEMACRELRYADFFRICREQHLERVAVAHNADDDIETMMLAMLRGSGTRGLRGMDIDNGRVIRPLLGISRTEIENYLASLGQDFITDSSNLTSDYRRNFIRHEVLPLLESRWPGARKSLSKTLSIIKEESEIVKEHYNRQLKTLSPDTSTLLVYAEGVSTGTILRFIEPFGGSPAIADEIMECVSKKFGKRRWILSDRHTAILERDSLIIMDSKCTIKEPTLIWEKIDMTPGLMEEIKNNRSHDTIYLPYDEAAYELRSPKSGDRMSPLGMKGSRLVSDIISDARLDHRRKEAVRVLVRRSDGEIIWVTGLKRSRHELVSPDTDIIYKATATFITYN
ncbi:MAG: tRNA lysidine(34) synthetase TilS [Muribaculaceae bacterium]|nr:tRNA lysidine(34) synthetase TilS [Muribaculaceae bacterium]